MLQLIRLKLILFPILILALFTKDLNAQTVTPPDTSYFVPWDDNYNLILAVDRADTISVKLLLNRGANVDANTFEGVTSLMYASESGNLDLVKILVESGADLNKKPVNGATALIVAAQKNYYDIAEYLVGKKAELNIKDEEGVTALHYAAAYNNFDIMDMLVFYGADKESSDYRGNTPLISASFNNCLESVDLLLQNGANIDANDNDGFTALMTAIQQGNTDIAYLLLEKGADIHAINKGGYSALTFAIMLPDIELTDELIKLGSDVNQKTEAGYSNLEIAKLSKEDEIVDLLQANDAKNNLNPHFNILSVGPYIDFNFTDIMNGLQVSLVDDKYGIGINGGFCFRPVANRVLDEVSNTLSIQYWERRFYFYAGLDKKFNLLSGSSFHTGPYLAVNELYSFGNYRGSDEYPEKIFITAPSIGWFYSNNAFKSWIGYQYMDFKTPEIKPGRINLGISVNISRTKKRLVNKKILWLE